MFVIAICLGLVVCSSQSAASPDPIRGNVAQPFADEPQSLSVVVYSSDGIIVDTSPVRRDASFTLYRLGTHNGDFMLHMLGALKEEFDPLFVRISNGHIQLVETHQDPLRVYSTSIADGENRAMDVTFAPSKKANYKQEKQPWRLKDLWGYRIRILQLAAVGFVVWFPQFIRSLPKELRDELMGEKDDDLGDPTAVFTALSGYKVPGSGPSTPASASKR